VTMRDGDVAYYLDGEPDGTGLIQYALQDSAQPLRIGNRGDLFTDFLGRMDDVAIFDGALSNGEIAEIMAGDFSNFGADQGDFSITNFSRSGDVISLTWLSLPGEGLHDRAMPERPFCMSRDA
jgi:hypothetical protein